MLLKFIGEYTGRRTTLQMGPYLFEGRKPTEVDTEEDIGARLARNPDFKEIHPLDHDGDGKKGGSLPKGDHVHVPADYEVDGLPPPSKRQRRRKTA